MKLTLVGVSHHRAPIELRERVALDLDACRALAQRLAEELGGEAVVLSTCNRTELYLARDERRRGGGRRGACASSPATAADELAAALYRLRDEAAALHLFRVAAGLDSLVPGEGEILGQVRSAFEAGAPGPLLDRLFRQALHTGRRVRVETAIGESPASVPSAAAALAQQVFGELDGRRVLLLGAGQDERGDRPQPRLARRRDRRRREPDARARRGARAEARRAGARARRGRGASSSTRTSSSRRRARPGSSSRARRVAARAARAQGPAAAARRPRRAARPRPGDQRARRLLPLRRRRPRGRRRGDALRPPRRGGAAPSSSSPRRPSASASGRRRSTSSRRSPRCARSPRRSATASSRRAGGRLSERERKHVESVTSQILAKLLHLPTIRMKEAAAAADGVVYADVVRHLFGLGEEERRR